MVSGLKIDHRSRNNLIQIARVLMEFVSDDDNNSELKEEETETQISDYFVNLVEVDDPSTLI